MKNQNDNLPLPSPDVGLNLPSLQGISSFTKRMGVLPHWQLPGSSYFLTFNTFQRKLLSPESRSVVLSALEYWDEGVEQTEMTNKQPRITLRRAVVMPDHVHILLKPLEKSPGVFWDLGVLMQSIKGFTAKQIKTIEGSTKQYIWQKETFDRIIRDGDEYSFVLKYIAWNPIKAQLALSADAYPWYVDKHGIGNGIIGDSLIEAEIIEEARKALWKNPYDIPNCYRD